MICQEGIVGLDTKPSLMVHLEYLLATIMDPILSVILAHRLHISMKRGRWNFVLGKRTSPGYLELNLYDFPYASFCYNYSFFPPTLKLLQCVAEQGVRCANERQV